MVFQLQGRFLVVSGSEGGIFLHDPVHIRMIAVFSVLLRKTFKIFLDSRRASPVNVTQDAPPVPLHDIHGMLRAQDKKLFLPYSYAHFHSSYKFSHIYL